MSKTSKFADVSEAIEFPTFDASKATDQLRVIAEKGVEQSKEVYAKVKAGAEDTQKVLETTFETAKSAGSEFSLKAISALRANSEVGFSHLEALVAARSLSEVVELQTAYFRKRYELSLEQAKEFQAIASKAAEDVAKPFKDAFEKGVKELKVA